MQNRGQNKIKKRGLWKTILLSLFFATSTSYAYNVKESAIQKPKVIQKGNLERTLKKEDQKPHTLKAQKQNPVTKYAIVIVGNSRGEKGAELQDPIDKNTFFLNGTYVYKHLQELGFKDKNMYFFYDDGQPDFSEKSNSRTIKYLQRHKFKSPRKSNMATISNLDKLVNKLSKKVDSNDVFVLGIGTHGNPSIIVMRDELLYAKSLEAIAKKIKPGFGLLFIDSCHSGAYIQNINLEDYVVLSGTQKHTYGWSDRDFSSYRYFFQNLMDPESDTNVDGKITIREAFERSNLEGLAHIKRIRQYLLKKYNWGSTLVSPAAQIKSLSPVQMIKAGKNVSDKFYFHDLGHFSSK
ncbi:MAG: caspase family protein [Nanoarchaeota archaeon]|nr:caspase family protein [Nanoarchaeota archaeon]